MILAVEFIVCDVYRAKIYIFFDKTKADKGHWNKKNPRLPFNNRGLLFIAVSLMHLQEHQQSQPAAYVSYCQG